MLPSDKDSAKKKDWDDCVAAIDDKGRDMKLKMNKLMYKYLHSLQCAKYLCENHK